MQSSSRSVALGAVDLHKSYGDVKANCGISLSVLRGEIHAIVGENGAGKSTLMRMPCSLLDEPTAVLAPPQVLELFKLLRKLRENGSTVVFISHKIGEVMALADKVTVIRQGQTVFQNRIADTNATEIAHHIINESDRSSTQSVTCDQSAKQQRGPVVLDIEDLSVPSLGRSQLLSNITIELHAGEVVGLAGVSGNCQVELVECIAGLRV